jgi:DNA polymerase-1
MHALGHTQAERWRIKNGFYAYCYGAEDKRLALTTNTPKGAFKKAVKEAYPQVAGFMQDVIKKGKERHEKDGLAWAKTMGGRTVAVPKSRVYALTNYIMQGSGADHLKLSLERVAKAGLADHVRLVVHDEILCCFPKGEGEAMAASVRDCMTTEFRGVPFVAHSAGPGRSWGDVA